MNPRHKVPFWHGLGGWVGPGVRPLDAWGDEETVHSDSLGYISPSYISSSAP